MFNSPSFQWALKIEYNLQQWNEIRDSVNVKVKETVTACRRRLPDNPSIYPHCFHFVYGSSMECNLKRYVIPNKLKLTFNVDFRGSVVESNVIGYRINVSVQ